MQNKDHVNLSENQKLEPSSQKYRRLIHTYMSRDICLYIYIYFIYGSISSIEIKIYILVYTSRELRSSLFVVEPGEVLGGSRGSRIFIIFFFKFQSNIEEMENIKNFKNI